MIASPPDGFSFEGNILPMNVLNATGIKVTTTSNLNNATIQCIAFVPNTQLRNSSTLAIATLQVAGMQLVYDCVVAHSSICSVYLLPSGEPGQFSCGPVSCSPLYSSGMDTTCTVQWSAPWTVDCAPLTSYTITVTSRDNGEVVSSSSQNPQATRMHNITVSEPAVDYTVIIVAVNRIGSNNCAVEFTSPKEQSRYVLDLVNKFSSFPFVKNLWISRWK